MTKKELKEISRMAAQMPDMSQKVFKKVTTKDGQDGYVALQNGVRINHKRRMKRAMKRGGKIQVLGYIVGLDTYLKNKNKE